LNRPANQINRGMLLQILETTIKECGMNEETDLAINHLDVVLNSIPDENSLGWDVFSLDYKLSSPLNTIFNDVTMDKYLNIFKYLWNVKRIEYLLTASWKTSKDNNTNLFLFLRHKMLIFLKNLNYYFFYEVLESGWNEFTKEIEEISKHQNLNSLIKCHEEFVEKISQKLFIEKSDIQNVLLNVFKLVQYFLNVENSSSSSRESNLNLVEQQFDNLMSQLAEISKMKNIKIQIEFK
jgi:gamma-tubulin complex component 3